MNSFSIGTKRGAKNKKITQNETKTPQNPHHWTTEKIPHANLHAHKPWHAITATTNGLTEMNKAESQKLGLFQIHQMNSCCFGKCVCAQIHVFNAVHVLRFYASIATNLVCLCLCVRVSRSTSQTFKKKALSVFLDMRDSSAWLQPAWTIKCRTQWLCNPPWLTGKETLATGTTTQFSSGHEVNAPQLGLGREGGEHTLHMNNFLNEHYLNWWLVS